MQFYVDMKNDFVYGLEFLTPKGVIGKCRRACNNASKSTVLFSNSDAVHGIILLSLNLNNSREISIGRDICTFSFLLYPAYLGISFANMIQSWKVPSNNS